MGQPYLVRRGGRYYVRLRVPLDLLRWFGRVELKRSLKTSRYESAKSQSRTWLYRTEKVFTIPRSGIMTDDRSGPKNSDSRARWKID